MYFTKSLIFFKSKPAVLLRSRRTPQARTEVRSPPKHLLWPLCQTTATTELCQTNTTTGFTAASDTSKRSDQSKLIHLTGGDRNLHKAIHSSISNTRFWKI